MHKWKELCFFLIKKVESPARIQTDLSETRRAQMDVVGPSTLQIASGGRIEVQSKPSAE